MRRAFKKTRRVEIDEYIRMYDDGCTISEIAKEFRKDRSSVRYWLRRKGRRSRRYKIGGDRH